VPQVADAEESIMISKYPEIALSREDPECEKEITLVTQVIKAIRNTRSQLHIAPSHTLEAVIEANDMYDTLEEESGLIQSLSKIDPLVIVKGQSDDHNNLRGVSLLVNPLVVRLPLEGVVDLKSERDRLIGELDNAMQNKFRVEKLVSNPNFQEKARPEVVETEQERLRTVSEQIERLEEIISQIS
jgi:valyl-tRNA synthetase